MARKAAHAALAAEAAALRSQLATARSAQRAAAARLSRHADALDALLPLVAGALDRRCDVERLLVDAARDEVVAPGGGGAAHGARITPAGRSRTAVGPAPATTTPARRRAAPAPTAAIPALMSLAAPSTPQPSADTESAASVGPAASKQPQQQQQPAAPQHQRRYYSDLPRDRRLAVLDALCERMRLRLTAAAGGCGGRFVGALEAALLASAALQLRQCDTSAQTEPQESPRVPPAPPLLPPLPLSVPTTDAGCAAMPTDGCDCCSAPTHGATDGWDEGGGDDALLMGAPFGLAGVSLPPELVQAPVRSTQPSQPASVLAAASQCGEPDKDAAMLHDLPEPMTQPTAAASLSAPPLLPSNAAAAVTEAPPSAGMETATAAAVAIDVFTESTQPPPLPPPDAGDVTIGTGDASSPVPSAAVTVARAGRGSEEEGRLATTARLTAVLQQWLA